MGKEVTPQDKQQIIWDDKTKKELAFSDKLTKTRNIGGNTAGPQLQRTASTCVDLFIYFIKQDYSHMKSKEGQQKTNHTIHIRW